jgi:hypothetical protein
MAEFGRVREATTRSDPRGKIRTLNRLLKNAVPLQLYLRELV